MAKSKSAKHPALQILQQKLEDQDFDATYIPANAEEELAFDSLLIILDEEPGEEDMRYGLQAFFVEDMMRAEDPDLPDEENPDFATLQFLLELPVDWSSFEGERLTEGYRLLGACSQKIPIGYFSLEGGEVFYTCSLLSEDQRVPTKVLISAVDMMGFFINRMTPIFEEFASENLTLETALERLDQRILAE
jgi:hypothetical protein